MNTYWVKINLSLADTTTVLGNKQRMHQVWGGRELAAVRLTFQDICVCVWVGACVLICVCKHTGWGWVCSNSVNKGTSLLGCSVMHLLNSFLAKPLQIPQWWIMDRKLWRDIRQQLKSKLKSDDKERNLLFTLRSLNCGCMREIQHDLEQMWRGYLHLWRALLAETAVKLTWLSLPF